jgi:hypothetical protein
MSIAKVKAFFKKYFNPRNVIIALVVLSSVGVYTTLNMRSKLSAVRSELSSSQTLNSLITEDKARLNALIAIYKDSISKRDIVISVKDKKIQKQLKEISYLQDTLKSTLNYIATIPPDSSYKYIDNRVVATSEKKYPFDSTQVKAIHYNFMERDGLFVLNTRLNLVVGDLRQLSYIKDNQIIQLKDLNLVYTQKGDLLKRENDAYQIRIEGLDKTVKQQKFLKTLSNGTVVGLTGYIIIKALLN